MCMMHRTSFSGAKESAAMQFPERLHAKLTKSRVAEKVVGIFRVIRQRLQRTSVRKKAARSKHKHGRPCT